MAAVAVSQTPPTAASASSFPSSLEAAGVSFLLKYWQGSAFSRDVGGGAGGGNDEAMERICKAVLGLKGHARWWLMRRFVGFEFALSL